MNNRVLMIAFHFPPQAASSGIQRTLSFSKHLGSHGWEPLVLSASPNAYEEKNPSQLRGLPADLIVRRAFTVDSKRHLGIRGRYPEIIALPDRWVTWWLSAVPVGLSLIYKYKPKVIWSTFPIASAHLIGLTLHRLTGLPWVADFRDPMYQDDYPKTRLQRKAYRWIERQVVAKCTKAVFTTHSAMDFYKQRFSQELHGKFTVIENGYDEDGFKETGSTRPTSSIMGKNQITLLHSGVLYTEGRDPSAFFDAISSLKMRGKVSGASLRVTLRASGEMQYFQALIEKYRIDDIVKLEPPVPYQEALCEMLVADGLLVFQGSAFNAQVPAKIYEYFRARRPIFGLVDFKGETAKVLGMAGFQSMAQIDDPASIVPALENLISEIRNETAGIASDELIAASSRRHRARQLKDVFDQVAGCNNRN